MSETNSKSRISINICSMHKSIIERVLDTPLTEYLEKHVERKFISIAKVNEAKNNTDFIKYIKSELSFNKKAKVINFNKLFLHYNKWCELENKHNIGKNNFCKCMREIDKIEVKRGGANVLKVYGLEIKDEWEL